MKSNTAVAARAVELMNAYGWSKDAVRSCNFEMHAKAAGPHCVGRAVNIAADELGVPFGPVHTALEAIIRESRPAFELPESAVDLIAEWNNHPSVTRRDVDAVLALL